MVRKLDLLRSHLESKQKELVEVLEQLRTIVKHQKKRRADSLLNEKEEVAKENFELERCLALERHIKNQLDGVVHALHRLEEEKQGSYR